jgi:hypothetical protein
MLLLLLISYSTKYELSNFELSSDIFEFGKILSTMPSNTQVISAINELMAISISLEIVEIDGVY